MSGLPQNIDAEQALLGILMFDNAAYERLPDALTPKPVNKSLFAFKNTTSAGDAA